MENLGHDIEHRQILSVGTDRIDPNFFKVSFSINGKVFIKAVDDLLVFEKESLDEVSDPELDNALNRVDYHRYTFLAAGCELETTIARKQRELKSWLAEAVKKVKLLIIRERRELKESENIPNNWFGSITKQEIEDKILTTKELAEEYKELQDTIAEMEKYKKVLFGLKDILQDRGSHLQSLIRRRIENKRPMTV